MGVTLWKISGAKFDELEQGLAPPVGATQHHVKTVRSKTTRHQNSTTSDSTALKHHSLKVPQRRTSMEECRRT